MGKTAAIDLAPAFDGHDLPCGAGSRQAQKRRAVISDKRNDENLAVAQTHLAFIRFHNRIVDALPGSVPDAVQFAAARELGRSSTTIVQLVLSITYSDAALLAPAARYPLQNTHSVALSS